MSRVQLLYQLQNLDSELDQAKKQLAEVEAALGESAALRQAKQAVKSAEQTLRKAQTLAQDLDLEVNSLTQKISQQEKLLYSGKAMSAKEAANLQDEVASLKRWREKREEALLEAMVAAEDAEAQFGQAQKELAAIEAGWTSDQAELVEKQRDLQTKIANLTEQRPDITRGISGDDLSEYEALRKKRAGRAVVGVKNGVCQGCGVTASHSKVQRARAGTELMYCSTCGRILYVP